MPKLQQESQETTVPVLDIDELLLLYRQYQNHVAGLYRCRRMPASQLTTLMHALDSQAQALSQQQQATVMNPGQAGGTCVRQGCSMQGLPQVITRLQQGTHWVEDDLIRVGMLLGGYLALALGLGLPDVDDPSDPPHST
jgi:hypothetical protein